MPQEEEKEQNQEGENSHDASFDHLPDWAENSEEVEIVRHMLPGQLTTLPKQLLQRRRQSRQGQTK